MPPDAAAVPDTALWMLLGGVVFPVWLAAGLLDYAIHYRQRIEHSTGPYESALHLLQALEVGAPMLIVLFLEVTAPVFLAVLALVLLHAWTSWRDTCFAASVRVVGPAEQKAHAVLDTAPWFALALLALIHRDALAPLLDPGTADWGLRLREAPFPPRVIAAVIAASLACGLLPAIAELRRGRRARAARQPPAARAG